MVKSNDKIINMDGVVARTIKEKQGIMFGTIRDMTFIKFKCNDDIFFIT